MTHAEKLVSMCSNEERAQYIFNNLPPDITFTGYHAYGNTGIIEEKKNKYIASLMQWLNSEVQDG